MEDWEREGILPGMGGTDKKKGCSTVKREVLAGADLFALQILHYAAFRLNEKQYRIGNYYTTVAN